MSKSSEKHWQHYEKRCFRNPYWRFDKYPPALFTVGPTAALPHHYCQRLHNARAQSSAFLRAPRERVRRSSKILEVELSYAACAQSRRAACAAR